ncbi:MAG: hypothetical protein JSV80_11185 [Acidobacteriota bacterium]|nr:MAG: hypothetical protein JSV80_11185 [Acidobacteriota bacterium]
MLFLALFVADVALVAWLFFHDFDQRAVRGKIREAYNIGRDLGAKLGEELAPGGAIDHLRIVERQQIVGQMIDAYTARLRIIDFVEVLTPDGMLITRRQRGRDAGAVGGQAFGGAAPPSPDSPPAASMPNEPGRWFAMQGRRSELVFQVPLGADAGTLLLGVTPGVLEAEFEKQRRSLVVQLLFGGAISVLLLAVAFLYVLRMVHRVRRFEAEAQRADQLASLGVLASGLAHEIRNPLNAMDINLQLLEEELVSGQLGDETVTLLRSSRAEVQRLERLVKEFLAFARPPNPRREEVALAELVDDVVRFSRPEFAEHGIELEVEHEEGTPVVSVDSGQIRQALLNILQNALEVSSRGQRVWVRTGATEQGEARVEIIDQGPGVAEENRERIFEVFWSQKPAGSGLGLPIAQRAIETHAGRIELESEPGHGSTFRMILQPAVSEGAEEALEALSRAHRSRAVR